MFAFSSFHELMPHSLVRPGLSASSYLEGILVVAAANCAPRYGPCSEAVGAEPAINEMSFGTRSCVLRDKRIVPGLQSSAI